MQVKQYQEGHIYLQYQRNLYTPSQLVLLRSDTGVLILIYDTGIPMAEKEAKTYVDRMVHINMTSKTGPKPVLSK